MTRVPFYLVGVTAAVMVSAVMYNVMQKREFMDSCSKDMKVYECEARYAETIGRNNAIAVSGSRVTVNTNR